MTLGSLPPLSPKLLALVSAEREIVPRPKLERRRAALRARTVLWHARQSAELPRTRSALAWWKRGSIAAFALLGATSAFAAWTALEPVGSLDGDAPGAGSAARRPGVARAAPRTSSPSQVGPSADSAYRGQTSLAAHDEPKPARVLDNETPPSLSKGMRVRPGSTDRRGTSPEELAGLDRARRAVAAGDFRAALQSVEQHARSFPKSQLGEEREALRVRALAGAGLSKKAGQAARDFESSYPNSVLVPELRNDDRTAP